MRFQLRPLMHYLAFVQGGGVNTIEGWNNLSLDADDLIFQQNKVEGFKKWNAIYMCDCSL